MDKDILALISRDNSGFSKGQRLIAKYILENYDKAAFMTAGKLGKTVGVSESTVVRFAAELGAALITACTKELDEAEQKVVKLRKGPDGEPEELPFEEAGE